MKLQGLQYGRKSCLNSSLFYLSASQLFTALSAVNQPQKKVLRCQAGKTKRTREDRGQFEDVANATETNHLGRTDCGFVVTALPNGYRVSGRQMQGLDFR